MLNVFAQSYLEYNFQMEQSVYSLKEWREAVLPQLRALTFPDSEIKNVTLLAYFFWRDERIETEFSAIECAFLAAFRCLGLMKAVLVTNRITPRMKSFAEHYQVEIQMDSALDSPDGVKALCIDSVSRLYSRFHTDYVLTLQTDGFPLNAGLERFLESYDYVGAPFPGHIYWYDFYPYPRFAVGNGGFSLRSRAICEAASIAYRKISRWIPYSQFFFGDDVFYCKTMPFFSSAWRRRFKYPTVDVALQFSIGFDYPTPKIASLGFHAGGFNEYCKRFGVPFGELLR